MYDYTTRLLLHIMFYKLWCIQQFLLLFLIVHNGFVISESRVELRFFFSCIFLHQTDGLCFYTTVDWIEINNEIKKYIWWVKYCIIKNQHQHLWILYCFHFASVHNQAGKKYKGVQISSSDPGAFSLFTFEAFDISTKHCTLSWS